MPLVHFHSVNTEGTIILNYTQIYIIFVLFQNTSKVIFVWKLLAFVTATPKKLLTACVFTPSCNGYPAAAQQVFQRAYQLNFMT